MSAAVITASGVAKSFGTTSVLSDITVDFPAGITGLLGSNGAGKTTLLSLVLGFEPRNGGNLTVLGHDPQTAGPEIRARIGYSPEHHHLPPDVQAADLVRHLAQLHGLPQQASTERASDALWLVGLGEERFRPIGTMSTGQRQRVKLAAAIAHDPELVLLDEPTDGLDPVQRDIMLELIHRVGTEYGISMVLSSHLLEEVERICDHVVIIANGVVIRSGNINEMRGGRTGVMVELDDGHELVAETLRKAGLIVNVVGSRLMVDAPPQPDEDPYWIHDYIRDVVVWADVGLRRLGDQTTSLEDVFLESNDAAALGVST
ncbi:MAG: ABC transporter ATP-binding protein [Acidimicrobiaceae bacterium]|nr:ABC transporter ATP-binding protein [Acidimicrobiaceae bacterium]